MPRTIQGYEPAIEQTCSGATASTQNNEPRPSKPAGSAPSRKIEVKTPRELYRCPALHASNVIKKSLREQVVDHLVLDHSLRSISATREVRIELIAKALQRL